MPIIFINHLSHISASANQPVLQFYLEQRIRTSWIEEQISAIFAKDNEISRQKLAEVGTTEKNDQVELEFSGAQWRQTTCLWKIDSGTCTFCLHEMPNWQNKHLYWRRYSEFAPS